MKIEIIEYRRGKKQDLTPLPCAMYGERRAKGKT
jgi:hypothetical protein